MYDFWGNFRGTEICRLCPLCQNHPDKQELLAECSAVKSKFGSIQMVLQNVYSQNVRTDEAKILVEVLQFREKIIVEKEKFAT